MTQLRPLLAAPELPQSLAHEPGLQPHVGVPHLAFDLGPGHQRRHGVHHQHVHGVAPHQHVHDVEGVLAAVGLGNQQIVDVHADLPGVGGVDGVFGVDDGAPGALGLRVGDNVKAQRGLAAGFGPVDLHDPPGGKPADAQSDIQSQRPGAENGHVGHGGLGPQTHDGALAELLFDLIDGDLERFVLVDGRDCRHFLVSHE